jgi:RAB protein geranylgeranyltransferase component A
MELPQDFCRILKIFQGNMYVIKDKLDRFKEKLAKIIQTIMSKSSDPEPVQLFRIQIYRGKKVSVRPDPDPQHWS